MKHFSARRLLAAAALVVPLAGCATSTGVLPAGPDTYTLTERFAPVRGGGTEAERVALTKANDFCVEKGRVFVPNLMRESGVVTRDYPTIDGVVPFLGEF